MEEDIIAGFSITKGWFNKMANFVKVCGWLNGDQIYNICQNGNSGDQ